MNVLDFYKVISEYACVVIYNRDDDIEYFHGRAFEIPVRYLDFVIRHITASYNYEANSIDYMLWV